MKASNNSGIIKKKEGMVKSIYITLIVVTIFSKSALSSELFIGISYVDSSLNSRSSSTDKQAGNISVDDLLLPTFSIKFVNNYFENSNWGYYFEFGQGIYYFDTQTVGIDNPVDLDLGTRINGQYWYLTPVIFYELKRPGPDYKVKFGVGYGVGYLSIHGDMIMTEEPGQPLLSLDNDSFTSSAGMFMEATYESWVMQLRAFGPGVKIDGYNLRYLNTSISIDRVFQF